MLSAPGQVQRSAARFPEGPCRRKTESELSPTLTKRSLSNYVTISIPDSLRNDPCETLHRFLRLAFASAKKANAGGE